MSDENKNLSFQDDEYTYDGNPNGQIKAPVGSQCRDLSSAGIWVKTSGASSATGWLIQSKGHLTTVADARVNRGIRFVFADDTNVEIALTIPNASDAPGQELYIKNTGGVNGVVATTNDVSFAGLEIADGGQEIYHLVSDGTTWHVVNRHIIS